MMICYLNLECLDDDYLNLECLDDDLLPEFGMSL